MSKHSGRRPLPQKLLESAARRSPFSRHRHHNTRCEADVFRKPFSNQLEDDTVPERHCSGRDHHHGHSHGSDGLVTATSESTMTVKCNQAQAPMTANARSVVLPKSPCGPIRSNLFGLSVSSAQFVPS